MLDIDYFYNKEDFIEWISKHKSHDELINDLWELMTQVKKLNGEKEVWKSIAETLKGIFNDI